VKKKIQLGLFSDTSVQVKVVDLIGFYLPSDEHEHVLIGSFSIPSINRFILPGLWKKSAKVRSFHKKGYKVGLGIRQSLSYFREERFLSRLLVGYRGFTYML